MEPELELPWHFSSVFSDVVCATIWVRENVLGVEHARIIPGDQFGLRIYTSYNASFPSLWTIARFSSRGLSPE